MMTAAVLCSAWQGSPLHAGRSTGIGGTHQRTQKSDEHTNELFLKEVGGLLGKTAAFPTRIPSTPATPSTVCSWADSAVETPPPRHMSCSPSTITTPACSFNGAAVAAIKIQAQVRRYQQQRQYQKIQQLQRRLLQIKHAKQEEIARIASRKDRKLRRIQRRHKRKELELDREYQKVLGIVQYLKRDEKQCRKELDNHRMICRDMKSHNQQLLLGHQRTLQAIEHTQHRVIDNLETQNDRLRETLLIQKEAIRYCQSLLLGLLLPKLPQPQPQPPSPPTTTTGTRRTMPLRPRPSHNNHHQNPRTNCYESSIKVNCVNEAEEKCFHYRLVQDVYTLTTTTTTR